MARDKGLIEEAKSGAATGSASLRNRAAMDALILLLLALPFYFLARHYDILERLAAFTHAHEDYELDELISLAVFCAFLLLVYSARRTRDLLNYSRELKEANRRLSQTLEEIDRLRRLLPVCAGCKKVRNDEGYWQEVDAYLTRYHLARITHGLCPDCMAKYYPEVSSELVAREMGPQRGR